MNATEPPNEAARVSDQRGHRSTAARPRKPIPVGTVWAPAGATCKTCGQPIRFRLTRLGRWQPLDADGADVHYHPRPPVVACPHCGSSFTVSLVDVPATYYGRATCDSCRRSWWTRRPPGAER